MVGTVSLNLQFFTCDGIPNLIFCPVSSVGEDAEGSPRETEVVLKAGVYIMAFCCNLWFADF